MPTPALPRSTPSAQGVDVHGITAFVDALEEAPHVEPHSLMLLRHGHVVAEGWWAPYAPDRLHLLYSLSKCFTVTALGLAIDEGRLSLDDTVISHFPELDAEITDARTRRILVRHLAAMASGHGEDELGAAQAADPKDLVRGFLLLPPVAEPGTLFAYNQPCTYTLATILGRVTGGSMLDYLRPRVLDPLGIGRLAWQRDAIGQELGYAGLHATTEDVARLGQLHLQRGLWQGRRLLSADWVAQASRLQVASPGVLNGIDWQQGYGFQLWMARHGYRADGAFGQFCVVLPEHDAVLALTAETMDMQAVLDTAWTHLLPALSTPSAPDPAAEAALAGRLARAELPRAPGSARPAAGTADAWRTFSGRASTAVPLTLAVGASPAGDGGWHASIDAVDTDGTALHLDVPMGTDGWVVAAPAGPDGAPLPLATSAAWPDEHTLHLDVVLLETPHRLRITATLPDRAVTATWRTTPLWDGPIHQLRAPAG